MDHRAVPDMHVLWELGGRGEGRGRHFRWVCAHPCGPCCLLKATCSPEPLGGGGRGRGGEGQGRGVLGYCFSFNYLRDCETEVHGRPAVLASRTMPNCLSLLALT